MSSTAGTDTKLPPPADTKPYPQESQQHPVAPAQDYPEAERAYPPPPSQPSAQQLLYSNRGLGPWEDDDMISAILLIIITLFLPPVGVLIIAGCGADFWLNVLFTILGFFPGHIHAFYVEYVYFKRRDEVRAGIYNPRRAPLVYSERVQRGGEPVPPPQQGYGTMPPQQPAY